MVVSSFLCHLALLSGSHVGLVTASTTTDSGILPPPPPPPPRDVKALHSTQSIIADDKTDELDKGESSVAPPPGEVQSKATTEEDHQGSLSISIDQVDTGTREESSNEKQTDTMSASHVPLLQNTWEQPNDAAEHTYTQTYQPYDEQQSWGYNQPNNKYQNSHNQGQWSQSNDYGHQWNPQGNQNYPKQYYNQPYPSQHQQHQQLVPYKRPQSNVKASASRFFNMAVQKLQTGIDSVSESLDTNKVVTSVSSLTSRLGEIGDAVSNSVGLSGSKGRPRPMHTNAAQGYPRQRMDPRLGAQPSQQEYAPPMSELYSLDTSTNQPPSESDSNDVYRDNQWESNDHGGDTDEFDSVTSYYLEQDNDSDSDVEGSSLNHGSDDPKLTDTTHADEDELNFKRPQSIRPNLSKAEQTERRQPSQTWPNGGSMFTSTTTRPQQYRDYDDYESASIGSKVKAVIGSVPIPNIKRMFKRNSNQYDDGAWSEDESKEKSKASTSFSSIHSRRAPSQANAVTVPRPVMSLLGKRHNLISPAASKRCASIGRTQAVFNAAQLGLVIFIVHEVLPTFHNALLSGRGELRSTILSTIIAATDGWTLHALCAIILISASNIAWIEPLLSAVSLEAAAESESEAAYTKLYLRLISSIPMKKSFPTAIRKAAQAEALNAASTARLHFFVTLAMSYVLISTVAVLKPAGAAIAAALLHLYQLDAWKQKPIVWDKVLESSKTVGFGLAKTLHGLIQTEIKEVREQPLRVVVVFSLLTALLVVSYLPLLEKCRKASSVVYDEDEEEDTITSLWSNIGSSSATRIGLLSSPRGVEGALDQFARLRPDRAASAGMLLTGRGKKDARRKRSRQSSQLMLSSIEPMLRKLAYLLLGSCVLLVPAALYIYVLAQAQSESLQAISLDGWISLLEMAALLFTTNILVGKAAHNAIWTANARLGGHLTMFFTILSSVVGEIKNLAAMSFNSDFQAMMTASPSAGIDVNDFWSAHSTRKAWATKGANIKCKAGEVVLLIGSAGAGKSRLLTSISEHIFTPPKSARTTTYARGTISIAGVDLSKWDRAQLQRRVGVWLHDVRTVSDYASLVTGTTLEEILEPVTDSQMSTQERNAVALAMKITGVGKRLSKQLPSRLSTVVSANEDELKPSSLRPPSYPLSPSDWSLVFLTKVLAQLIAGNANQQASSNEIAKCLIGSILLLDDATSQMSEIDEAKFINALRSTGAAVILTSNRWATGRFADRIVVLDNGSVVESGTHADLMNIGPERSLYAHQWNVMSLI
eukprot:scaffold27535_cov69-Cyclotella_meneghiniana.AAC.10